MTDNTKNTYNTKNTDKTNNTDNTETSRTDNLTNNDNINITENYNSTIKLSASRLHNHWLKNYITYETTQFLCNLSVIFGMILGTLFGGHYGGRYDSIFVCSIVSFYMIYICYAGFNLLVPWINYCPPKYKKINNVKFLEFLNKIMDVDSIDKTSYFQINRKKYNEYFKKGLFTNDKFIIENKSSCLIEYYSKFEGRCGTWGDRVNWWSSCKKYDIRYNSDKMIFESNIALPWTNMKDNVNIQLVSKDTFIFMYGFTFILALITFLKYRFMYILFMTGIVFYKYFKVIDYQHRLNIYTLLPDIETNLSNLKFSESIVSEINFLKQQKVSKHKILLDKELKDKITQLYVVHKNIDHDDIVEAKFSNLSKNQQDSVDNIIEIIVNTVFS